MTSNSVYKCTNGKVAKSCQSCGAAIYVWPADAKRGYGKYCGVECKKAAVRRHGLHEKGAEDIGQNSYYGAKMRCHNTSNPGFAEYGGRGIAMCDRWRFGENGRTGIECFFEDMGARPSADHSIERTDNEAGYSPGNCIWATQKVQVRNRRNTRAVLRSDGVSFVNAEAASDATGIHPENIKSVCRGRSKTAGGYRWSYVEN